VTVARVPCLIAFLATAILLCAAASPAQAYVIDGVRWPGTTITYYPTTYRTAVDRAARNWNNANVGVRFRRAPSASRAEVLVELGAQQCGGFSIVGWPRGWGQSWVKLAGGCDRDLMTMVATHELGHTLGLGHEMQRCARMNPVVDYSGTPEFCQYHPIEYWLAHPLKGDDIRGARALYGSPARLRVASRPRVIG
jgi:Astacin (Peptidase family M12A)